MDGRDIRTLASEVDSTIRLVRELVREAQLGASPEQIRGRMVDLADHLTRRSDVAALPALVVRAHAEVIAVLGEIRLGRETLTSYRGASAETEPMKGIDRSLALLEEVEGRMRAVAALFNERTPTTGDVVADHAGSNGDPRVGTVKDRQAKIDAAFAATSPLSSVPGPR